MGLYFFKSPMGCGIREFRTLRSAEVGMLRECGEYNAPTLVRKATPEDIEWVKGMGGYIPEDL